MNVVILEGRLGADPEMRYTASGSAVTTVRLAVDEYGGKDKEKRTEWFNLVFWNKTAETVAQHLSKGRELLVEGRMQSRSWDGPDGQKRYKTEIVVNRMHFIGGGNGGGGDHAAGPVYPDDIDPDDLPFE